MIVVCDIGEIWRERPFAAMAGICPVLGVVPSDRKIFKKNKAYWASRKADQLMVLPVLLLPGWASRTAILGQRILWWKIKWKARKLNEPIDTVVITSPHYRVLLQIIPKTIRTVYYASDDYRNYEAWGNMEKLEQSVVSQVDHAFFVSEVLAERAREEYGHRNKIGVSMNASEERFLPAVNEVLPTEPPTGKLARPIAGIIGGINSRIDFDLLTRIADLPELGTLLLVGPLPENPPEKLIALLKQKRCLSVGAQPHTSLHAWFKCLDLGLIPYVESELNKSCSPMRLFDHLATGVPIVATAACNQVSEFSENVDTGSDADGFVDAVRRKLKNVALAERTKIPDHILWEDRAREMLKFIRGNEND